jgi:antitoxin (DNA-binding transcriptional repressor) of toxin-antitoxin stability system
MRAVARRTLEDRFDEYLHLVEEGETILVTEQDRVIAELVPPREVVDASHGGAQGVSQDWMTPAAVSDKTPPPRIPVAPLAQILRELAEDREDR